MAPTQGRIVCSWPALIFLTMCGSAMCARVIPTMSSLPAAIAWRAVATSVMRAAWNTGRPVAARISPAKSRCGADGMPMIGIVSSSALSVSMWPRTTLRKSTRPASAKRRPIAKPSSFVRPIVPALVAGHADADQELVADRLAHRLEHAQGEAHPVLEAAAPLVVAPVGRRRPELVGQVAVGVDLAAVEPGRLHPRGGRRVVGDDALDVPLLDRLGEAAVRGLADRRRRQHRQPVGLVPGGAPAEVGELDHHRRPVLVALVGELPHPGDDLVLVGQEVAEDRRRIRRDHRRARGHGERDAALRPLDMVEPVAVLGHAVLGIGRLVAGRHDAVAQAQVLELVGLQQRIPGLGHRLALPFRPAARRRRGCARTAPPRAR